MTELIEMISKKPIAKDLKHVVLDVCVNEIRESLFLSDYLVSFSLALTDRSATLYMWTAWPSSVYFSGFSVWFWQVNLCTICDTNFFYGWLWPERNSWYCTRLCSMTAFVMSQYRLVCRRQSEVLMITGFPLLPPQLRNSLSYLSLHLIDFRACIS